MMECSWKTILLLVCASLGIQYTAIRSLTASINSRCPGTEPGKHCHSQWRGVSSCSGMTGPQANDQTPTRKHILIFATTRSGSSFLGQLFNQHPAIFYLYEPLYHVQQVFANSSTRVRNTLDRRALLGAHRDLLSSLYDCNLNFLENYMKPTPRDHETTAFFRRGASNALCEPPLCHWDRGSKEVIEYLCARRCRALNLTLASQVCRARPHVAIKTVRIPEIKDIRLLSDDPRLDLKIIHLVRDPRGILASRMGTFTENFRAWKIWNATGRKPHSVDLSQIATTCNDLLNSAGTGLSRPPWLRGKYMLVRYEELAREPFKKTAEIYHFIGLDVDSQVKRWILHNTRATSGSTRNYKYTTTRNSSATAENWRLNLSFQIVQTVQQLCNDTLNQLGYQLVQSLKDLRNLSNSLVEPKIFAPFL
ncbi:carbohydrate sulfotransferase 1-like [Chiloscyllium plagiosum]|uniref:carbohydrate sulfotransferase 1-like n=1 Tax=Chiloscyllium plagiosum TaxID=36176 RepID=UPI001CB7FE94|nr:carbohydrate sulfotransferase 1-like [Chiloscyllium plagiosum]